MCNVCVGRVTACLIACQCIERPERCVNTDQRRPVGKKTALDRNASAVNGKKGTIKRKPSQAQATGCSSSTIHPSDPPRAARNVCIANGVDGNDTARDLFSTTNTHTHTPPRVVVVVVSVSLWRHRHAGCLCSKHIIYTTTACSSNSNSYRTPQSKGDRTARKSARLERVFV